MTGGYHLLLPSLWVCTLVLHSLRQQSIYASQVESRSLSPAHQGSLRAASPGRGAREQVSFPAADRGTLPPDDPLATVIDRLSERAFPVLPVVDGERRLLGVVTLEEVHLASQAPT